MSTPSTSRYRQPLTYLDYQDIEAARALATGAFVATADQIAGVSGEELDQAIANGVARIGSGLGATFSVLVRLRRGADGPEFEVVGATAGTPSSIDHATPGAFPWLDEQMLADADVVVRSLDDVPPTALEEHAVMNEIGMQACIAVPIGTAVSRGVFVLFYEHPLQLAAPATDVLRMGGYLLLEAAARRRGESSNGVTLSHVVASKLAPPTARPSEIPRAGLLDQLRKTASPIVIVTAPAGMGKSSLVASWTTSDDLPTAWVSLDAQDGDPRRLWLHVVSAIGGAGGSVANAIAALHAGAHVRTTVVPIALDAMRACPMRLVLDDYHLVQSSDIDATVATLAEHLPGGSQLVLVSRLTPDLSIERWRANGRLDEIRAADLRLTIEEATELFTRCLGLQVDADCVAQLHERTEGWMACLYLAGMALAAAEDQDTFVADFSGSQRSVLGYLLTEVLHGLDPDVLAFLRTISVLDRCSGPLADALTNTAGGVALLLTLERTNPFVIALDDTGEWFRVHHLLQDALLFELRAEAPDEEERLHGLAAHWYSGAGHVNEALEHATASRDLDLVVEMLQRHWLTIVSTGRMDFVVRTLALVEDRVLLDPELAAAACYCAGERGDTEQARQFLSVLRAADPAIPFKIGMPDGPATAAALSWLFYLDGFTASLEAARSFEHLKNDGPAFWRGCAALAVGLERWNAADDICAELLAEAARVLEFPAVRLRADSWLANILLDMGDEAGALQHAVHGRAIVDAVGFGAGFRAAPVTLAEARLALTNSNHDDARRLVRKALDLNVASIRYDQALYLLARAIPMAEGLDEPELHAIAVAQAINLLEQHPDAGRAGTLARDAVKGVRVTPTTWRPFEDLTAKERGVLRLLSQTDLSQVEIARELDVSVNTMKTHVKALYRKLGVTSRSDAAERARQVLG